eukprot:540092-Lingulodinium_polyedra.AAC.1
MVGEAHLIPSIEPCVLLSCPSTVWLTNCHQDDLLRCELRLGGQLADRAPRMYVFCRCLAPLEVPSIL